MSCLSGSVLNEHLDTATTRPSPAMLRCGIELTRLFKNYGYKESKSLGRPHLTTFLYALAAWFIFNIIFAAAMYFRPTRKKQGSGSITDQGGRRGQAMTFGKLLFFGFWLNGRHPSV